MVGTQKTLAFTLAVSISFISQVSMYQTGGTLLSFTTAEEWRQEQCQNSGSEKETSIRANHIHFSGCPSVPDVTYI